MILHLLWQHMLCSKAKQHLQPVVTTALLPAVPSASDLVYRCQGSSVPGSLSPFTLQVPVEAMVSCCSALELSSPAAVQGTVTVEPPVGCVTIDCSEPTSVTVAFTVSTNTVALINVPSSILSSDNRMCSARQRRRRMTVFGCMCRLRHSKCDENVHVVEWVIRRSLMQHLCYRRQKPVRHWCVWVGHACAYPVHHVASCALPCHSMQ